MSIWSGMDSLYIYRLFRVSRTEWDATMVNLWASNSCHHVAGAEELFYLGSH